MGTPRHSRQVGATRAKFEDKLTLLYRVLSDAVVAMHERLIVQAVRAISTSQLQASRLFHTWPINVVVYDGSMGKPSFEGGFTLRCFQRLSRPHLATQLRSWQNDWCTRGASIPVLSY